MIPTMILLGFVVGRWWKIALPLVAVGWPLTLIASGVIDLDAADVVGAAIFGVANAAVGAGVFLAIQGGVRIVTRSLRRS